MGNPVVASFSLLYSEIIANFLGKVVRLRYARLVLSDCVILCVTSVFQVDIASKIIMKNV